MIELEFVVFAPDDLTTSDEIPSLDDPRLCSECGHAEGLHETFHSSGAWFDLCHSLTAHGECHDVRQSEGIPLGACRGEQT